MRVGNFNDVKGLFFDMILPPLIVYPIIYALFMLAKLILTN